MCLKDKGLNCAKVSNIQLECKFKQQILLLLLLLKQKERLSSQKEMHTSNIMVCLHFLFLFSTSSLPLVSDPNLLNYYPFFCCSYSWINLGKVFFSFLERDFCLYIKKTTLEIFIVKPRVMELPV